MQHPREMFNANTPRKTTCKSQRKAVKSTYLAPTTSVPLAGEISRNTLVLFLFFLFFLTDCSLLRNCSCSLEFDIYFTYLFLHVFFELVFSGDNLYSLMSIVISYKLCFICSVYCAFQKNTNSEVIVKN